MQEARVRLLSGTVCRVPAVVRSVLDLVINDIVWSLNDYHHQGDKLMMGCPWCRSVAVQDSLVFLSRQSLHYCVSCSS